MTREGMRPLDEADLIDAGLLRGAGQIDVAFFSLKLRSTVADVERVLEHLATRGIIRAEQRWYCGECGASVPAPSPSCETCGGLAGAGVPLKWTFWRPEASLGRDPEALFVIHGMTSIGAWQQEAGWSVQLNHRYGLPIRIFKYGWDWWSPWLRSTQRYRSRRLGRELREAWTELVSTRANARFDVIAHSYGTLLLCLVLADPEFNDLRVGRVILCGAIAPEDYCWAQLVEAGRIEAVLNHRGGKDVPVRLAPWAIPGASSTGVNGFRGNESVEELCSADFGHSDFFTDLKSTLETHWEPFLHGLRVTEGQDHGSRSVSRGRGVVQDLKTHRYWVGRAALLGLLVLLVASAWSKG